MKLTGILVQGGVVNHNHRIYSEETLSKMVQQFKQLKEPMLGEFGESQSIVSLSHVSHKVTDINKVKSRLPRKKKKKFKKNNLYTSWKMTRSKLVAEIEILNTPQGNVLKKLIDEKNEFDIAPSGIGNVNESGLVENYTMLSANIIPKSNNRIGISSRAK